MKKTRKHLTDPVYDNPCTFCKAIKGKPCVTVSHGVHVRKYRDNGGRWPGQWSRPHLVRIKAMRDTYAHKDV